jgi:hypothetical protein
MASSSEASDGFGRLSRSNALVHSFKGVYINGMFLLPPASRARLWGQHIIASSLIHSSPTPFHLPMWMGIPQATQRLTLTTFLPDAVHGISPMCQTYSFGQNNMPDFPLSTGSTWLVTLPEKFPLARKRHALATASCGTGCRIAIVAWASKYMFSGFRSHSSANAFVATGPGAIALTLPRG